MRKTTRSILLITVALTCFQPGLLTAYGQGENSAKIASLLETLGYTYSKVSNNVWSVPFEGKVLKDFDLIVTAHEDLLVLFVLVTKKGDMRVTPELMQKMLRLNADLDRVKVGIDKDGDAFVRVDMSTRVLDSREFKANVDQVGAAADEVFKAIKPFTTATR